MVLNSTKVYNFTPFVSMHPGGSTMVPYCGKNGDPGFASVPHSSNAVALETTYLIGALVAAPAPISVTITPPMRRSRSAEPSSLRPPSWFNRASPGRCPIYAWHDQRQRIVYRRRSRDRAP